MITFTEIWLRARTPREAVALLRAYYRTGQLVDADCYWALVRFPANALQITVLGKFKTSTLGKFKETVLESLLTTASLEDLPSGGWSYSRRPSFWDKSPPKLYRQVLAFTIATLMYSDLTLKPPNVGWTYYFDLYKQWLLRAIPPLRTSSRAGTKRAVLTYLRLHASLVIDWTILLSDVLSAGDFTIVDRTMDFTIVDILTNDGWPEAWNKYMEPTQPTAPARDQISFLEVQRQTTSDHEMVRWLRAYYRTGQLRPIDQALLATVSWDPDMIAEDVAEVEGPPKTHDVAFHLYANITPTAPVIELIKLALPDLSPRQLSLYRVYEFLTYVASIYSNTGNLGDAKLMRYGMDLNELAEDMRGFTLPPKMGPDSDVDERYAELWAIALAKGLEVVIKSYASTMKAVYKQRDASLLVMFKKRLSNINLAGLHPILQAYCELLQAALGQPEDPVGYLLHQGTNFPELYAAVPPTFSEEPTFQLPPALNQVVYSYALAPSYDQVLHRLPTVKEDAFRFL